MVQGDGRSDRATGRQRTFLDLSGMGCGKTAAARKPRQDRMEKLEREMAGKSRSGRWDATVRMEKVSDGKRSRFEIIADILRHLREPTCWTNVMSHCNLSSRQAGQYLSLLRLNDLVQMDTAAGKAKYQRTEAGRQFLKGYGKIVLLLDPSIPAPLLP